MQLGQLKKDLEQGKQGRSIPGYRETQQPQRREEEEEERFVWEEDKGEEDFLGSPLSSRQTPCFFVLHGPLCSGFHFRTLNFLSSAIEPNRTASLLRKD
ncbi:unnamed protein product [Microthlaspi erraticum]|uniref:Uncharacterized protein n=1 Tax=Microthlaspi erraticum TaxID=1685480 RepID=A0A6D2J260_9BRAS|nr:unnamed protein product [Microthlaspi erraticum]